MCLLLMLLIAILFLLFLLTMAMLFFLDAVISTAAVLLLLVITANLDMRVAKDVKSTAIFAALNAVVFTAAILDVAEDVTFTAILLF